MSKQQRKDEFKSLLAEIEKAGKELIERDLDYNICAVPHPALTAAFILEEYIRIVLAKKQEVPYTKAKPDITEVAFEAELSSDLMKKQTFH